MKTGNRGRLITAAAALFMCGTTTAAAQTPVVEASVHTSGQLPASIPPVTEEDRKAAFPDVSVSPVDDNLVHSLARLDRFEWQSRKGQGGPSWEARGWIGLDRNRLWFRTEGDTENADRIDSAEAHALYGHMIARWWDVVAGIRQDIRPGAPQTWAAVGIQGVAPYWFELDATAYLATGGRTQLRFEVEYELLLTNRLVLQPLVEMNVFGKADPERAVDRGLATSEVGLRMRYAIRREFAPYVGVTWNQKHFGTAEMARAAGEHGGGTRVVVGVRMWR